MKSTFGISAAAISCFCALCAASSEPGGFGSSAQGSTRNVVVSRKADLKIEKGPEKYFTGSVQIAGLFQREDPSRVTGAIVSFEPGARTAWHTHPAGQTLIVTEGIGLVQNWGGAVQEIQSGDIIWIPPGVKHWHGASGRHAMSHVAIQEKVNGLNVEWMEHVSDQQYNQVKDSGPFAAAANWPSDDLERIATKDDLHISPYREDGKTYGTPTWIWSVAVEGSLYVRAYNGVRSRWYQAAIRERAGRIIAAGVTRQVTFEPVQGTINVKVDAAYRVKYAGSPYLDSMIGEQARAATVKILPAPPEKR